MRSRVDDSTEEAQVLRARGQALVARTAATRSGRWPLCTMRWSATSDPGAERGGCLHPECLALEVDTSFASRRVTRVLDAIVAERGQPLPIRCDNGPE